MRRSLILALAFLAATPAAAQAPSLRETALALHNEARARVGAPPLVWDPKLADAAAVWARELGRRDRMEHSPWEIRRGQGENLSMGARGYFSDAVLMRSWFAEADDYRAGVFPEVSRTGRWQDVGHYTQAIWRGTTAIGCARGSSRTQDYLVCRYSPPGNMLGQRVE
jgi:hypothetical protein